MKFFWGEEKTTLKEILIELSKQYKDCFQHVGLNDFNDTIKPNLDLLLIVIDELKDDSELEFDKLW
jgi:hypothetical protein